MNEQPLKKMWNTVLENIQSRLENSRAFDIWIKPVKLHSITDKILTIEIPNMIFQKGFAPFINILKEEFSKVAGFHPEIQFTYTGTEEKQKNIIPGNLNSEYVFEHFVVGPCNRLAHAAALAVSQSPGTAYNPLFLYGDVGLGKTHLIQSIGHFGQERENLKVAYISCEVFVNLFIQSIQKKTTSAFRNRFRNLDYLLIDDIHFIAGKEGTQEEFFHTFNTLYDHRKQIVLSSDRPPKEIAKLEKRLISRFEWGLVVDLQPPDFETRVAILKKKCELKKLKLPDDIVFFIAENVKDNIRLLEGVLNRLIASSSLLSREINIFLAEEIIKEVEHKERTPITLDLITQKVGLFFHLSQSELRSTRRTRHILLPRQIAMYLARELTNNSLTSIAEEFSGKDHTTVLHSYKKIKKLLGEDDYLNGVIERIKNNLNE